MNLELNGGGGGGGISSILNLLSQGRRRSRSNTSDSQNLYGERTDDIQVNNSAATVLGKTNVEEKDGLEDPVKGNPVKNSIAPELNDAEESIDNPVSQEVRIIGR